MSILHTRGGLEGDTVGGLGSPAKVYGNERIYVAASGV